MGVRVASKCKCPVVRSTLATGSQGGRPVHWAAEVSDSRSWVTEDSAALGKESDPFFLTSLHPVPD